MNPQEQKQSPLGLFGPGIGALLIAREVLREGEANSIVCFSDRRNSPFSTRSDSEIISLIDSGLEILSTFGVSQIVIGCNTSSRYLERVQAERDKCARPHFDCVDLIPITVEAISSMEQQKLLLLGSPVIGREKIYTRALSPLSSKVITEVGLTGIAADLDTSSSLSPPVKDETARTLKTLFQECKPDAVVNVCTHFDLVTDFISGLAQEALGVVLPVYQQSTLVAPLLRQVLGLRCSSAGMEPLALADLEVVTNVSDPSYHAHIRELFAPYFKPTISVTAEQC